MRGRWLGALLLIHSVPHAEPAPPTPSLLALQPLIDAAPTGTTFTIPPGHYAGPVVVERSLTLEGNGAVVIDGQGHGTVVTLRAMGTTLRGVTVIGSGESHDQLDAAILVQANGVHVEKCVIADALFGVVLTGSNDSLVCGNRISSKVEEPGLRGDGIRVWSGGHNRVVGNELVKSRDLSLANTVDNLVAFNVVRSGRTGVHLVFSPRTRIEGNWLDSNLTGMQVLYSNDVEVLRNRIQHSRGMAGTGLALKESSRALVESNAIIHCGTGVKLNAPTSPESIVTFRDNTFAHNVAGMDFYGENGGDVLEGNRFEHNLVQVAVSAPMSARGNGWRGNSWDDYQGFDRDHDGIGDTPYEMYFFADRIWMETPQATFFRGSPAMELIDFLERLAPFASPELILRDERPRLGSQPGSVITELPAAPFCP